jgi:hypothetical protein
VVGDVRIIRNNARMQSDNLAAMRAYYEPEHRVILVFEQLNSIFEK